MKTFQKVGGIAALIGASTNLLAIVMFITLASRGYGSADPGQAVAFFADNQALMRVLYLIQYLVFGVSLIFLSMALYERLKAGSPVLAQAVTTFGLIWAILVIVIGTLSIKDLSTVGLLPLIFGTMRKNLYVGMSVHILANSVGFFTGMIYILRMT